MNKTEVKILRYTPSEGCVFWVNNSRSELIVTKDENYEFEEITIAEAEEREKALAEAEEEEVNEETEAVEVDSESAEV